MRRVDWNSPAQLLEQIIHHEAVHAVDGWDDLRRRLQPDRRCFAFFHPQLPDEPLIFVEVALLPEMPSAIAPLIDKTSDAAAARAASASRRSTASATASRGCATCRWATSSSSAWPSNCSANCRGCETFCTLSPVPRLGRLAAGASPTSPRCRACASAGHRRAARRARENLRQLCGGDLGRACRAPRRTHNLGDECTKALLSAVPRLPAVPGADACGRPGGALPPRQRRTAGAAQRRVATCRPRV